jgi:hypothetical protein
MTGLAGASIEIDGSAQKFEERLANADLGSLDGYALAGSRSTGRNFHRPSPSSSSN